LFKVDIAIYVDREWKNMLKKCVMSYSEKLVDFRLNCRVMNSNEKMYTKIDWKILNCHREKSCLRSQSKLRRNFYVIDRRSTY